MTIPALKIISIEGSGDPGCPAHLASAKALYNLAHTLKFALKERDASKEFEVMPSERLRWTTAPDANWHDSTSEQRFWKLFIVQPDLVTEADFLAAKQAATQKIDVEYLEKLAFEVFEEGLSAQVLHVGPYSTEPATQDALFDWFQGMGYEVNGLHHEIYLSDFTKTALRS